jgi:hypothetical protein
MFCHVEFLCNTFGERQRTDAAFSGRSCCALFGVGRGATSVLAAMVAEFISTAAVGSVFSRPRTILRPQEPSS